MATAKRAAHSIKLDKRRKWAQHGRAMPRPNQSIAQNGKEKNPNGNDRRGSEQVKMEEW